MIDHIFKVRRYISIFDNTTELEIKEIELKDFDLSYFQEVFGVTDKENPLFDCYAITEEIAEQLEAYIATTQIYDFEKFSYFLEAENLE